MLNVAFVEPGRWGRIIVSAPDAIVRSAARGAVETVEGALR